MTAAELTRENAKFYDHAKNQGNVAVGSAIARVRRDAIESGEAYTVVARWNGRGATPFYWDGGRYDAIGLAKQIASNGGAVRLIRPDGSDVAIENCRY